MRPIAVRVSPVKTVRVKIVAEAVMKRGVVISSIAPIVTV